jgi:hypothetical protein
LTRELSVGIRIAGLVVLLCVSIEPYTAVPAAWWWAALAVLTFWSVLDHDNEESDD